MRREYEELLRQWLQRRSRMRRWLRPLPRHSNVHRYPVIKWFAGQARRRPYLWSFKYAQVVPAIYVGSVISLLPIYGVQILVALGAALLLRANLTVLVALQFITNPLTVVPIYAFTGWVGVVLMRAMGMGAELPAAMYYAQALFIGGVVVGLATGAVADLGWRLAAWEARRFRARLAQSRKRLDPP
jgi:uncharacterized protein (DUF2062 family)